MRPALNRTIHFGTFMVAPQVFHITAHSYALVNLKPLLRGHVLISPLRVVPRFNDLTPTEVSDLFATVQAVSRMVTRVYAADALNIAIQDGEAAGQSVAHVHCHVIPRHSGDMDSKGGSDAIYDLMQSEEGDVGAELRRRQQQQQQRTAFAGPDVKDEDRKPRSAEEMNKEAEFLAGEMEKENN